MISTVLRAPLRLGLSLGVSLSLMACTEDPPKPVPQPTKPEPNAAARDFADYTRLVPGSSDEFDTPTLDLQKWT